MEKSVEIDIAVVGSLNMDLVTTAVRLPNVGETVLGHSFATFVGGKGFNQAVAARRAGSCVALVGKLGRDNFGDQITVALQQEGILADSVTRCADPNVSSGVAAITVDAQGANAITVVPGANFQLTAQDAETAAESIQRAKVLLLQLEVPVAVCIKAAQIAHQAGVKIILTAAPVPDAPLPTELLNMLDLLILNEVEVRQLAELHIPKLPRDIEEVEAARHLLGVNGGPTAIVVTLGKRGALWVDAKRSYYAPAFAATPLDTTAAGDAFTGALATALSLQLPLPEALRFANAAGALTVTKKGASASLPYRDEIEHLLQ